MLIKCEQCGDEFNKRPAKMKTSKRHFCRKLCHDDYQRIHRERAFRNYQVDEDFFDQIDRIEKAYWLGFIFADGYVNRTRLSVDLNIKDRAHLYLLKRAMKSDHPVVYEERHSDRYKNGKVVRAYIQIYSTKIAARLRELGIVAKRKTFDFTQIPEHLHSHWWRGFFDGDGRIGAYTQKTRTAPDWRWNVIGHTELLEKAPLPLSLGHIHPDGTMHRLWAFKKDTVRSIYKYLYQDSNQHYLKRKYDKFRGILQSGRLPFHT